LSKGKKGKMPCWIKVKAGAAQLMKARGRLKIIID